MFNVTLFNAAFDYVFELPENPFIAKCTVGATYSINSGFLSPLRKTQINAVTDRFVKSFFGRRMYYGENHV
jgi:hypothetical protein